MIHRRDFYRIGTNILGGLFGLALAVPGVAFLLSPVLRRGAKADEPGEMFELARLSELQPGVPRAFTVRAGRKDAWVNYPPEPIGTVWLIRQEAGAAEPVIAYSAECPHLGCSVNLSADGQRFACPCHNSAFALDGTPVNAIPPRKLDTLTVELTRDEDPWVRVRFQRFRTMSKEKIPVA